MSTSQLIIKLVKNRKLNLSALIILGVIVLFFLFVLLTYHFLNNKLNPTLQKSTLRWGRLESVNEYQNTSYEIIGRENPLPSVPPDSYEQLLKQAQNQFVRERKSEVVRLTIASAIQTPKDTEFHSDLIRERDKNLDYLRLNDPNSEIIPHTQDFIRRYEQKQKLQ